MVFFEDFGKVVKDLFKKKDYEVKRSIKLKCTSDNTEWTTESCFPITGDGESTSKAKYKQTDKTFGKITIEVPSTKAMKLDYETPGFVDGLKVNMICELPKTSLEAKYEQGQNAVKLCLETSTDNASNIGLAAEVAREIQGVWLGGEVKYNIEEGVTDYMTGVHYKTSDTQLSCKTNFDKVEVKLHKSIEGGEVAADYSLTNEGKDYLVSVGGKWNLDDKSSAQGFIQSDGGTYLLYKHKLSERCTAHLGTAFDITGVEGVNVHYKFEFEA